MTSDSSRIEPWPSLPFSEWGDTSETLHLWTQIVGKVRLSLTPWLNHSWHVTLYPTARGLTTGPIPAGPRTIELAFDFFDHRLSITTSAGELRTIALEPMSVAAFYRAIMAELKSLHIEPTFFGEPNEVADPIPFADDEQHASYDPGYAQRFWVAMSSATRVMSEFRARFLGKCSPVHFFWGSFDLAVTRFSGKAAPTHPGGVPGLPDWVTVEAYSHEVSSAGFWTGNAEVPPIFYSYAYPTPEAFGSQAVRPSDAYFHKDLGEFVLPYDAVRQADSPENHLMEFLQSTYEAAAETGAWDREALEFTAPPEASTTSRMSDNA
jgi:hypothetical protein